MSLVVSQKKPIDIVVQWNGETVKGRFYLKDNPSLCVTYKGIKARAYQDCIACGKQRFTDAVFWKYLLYNKLPGNPLHCASDKCSFEVRAFRKFLLLNMEHVPESMAFTVAKTEAHFYIPSNL